MHVRYFGEPWPNAENPAPVCADDTYKIATPVGTKCIQCGKKITEKDRGVVTAASPRLWEHWHLAVTGYLHTVVTYHLSCFLEVVLGGEIAGTVVEQRARGAEQHPLEEGETAPAPQVEDEAAEETHQPGKGWR